MLRNPFSKKIVFFVLPVTIVILSSIVAFSFRNSLTSNLAKHSVFQNYKNQDIPDGKDWEFPTSELVINSAYDEKNLYFFQESTSELFSLDKFSGNQKWKTSLDEIDFHLREIHQTERFLIFVIYSGKQGVPSPTYCIDKINGQVIWKKELIGNPMQVFSDELGIVEGVSGDHSIISAINLESGEEEWNVSLDGEWVSDLTFDDDGNIILGGKNQTSYKRVGESFFSVFAIDAKSGKKLWEVANKPSDHSVSKLFTTDSVGVVFTSGGIQTYKLADGTRAHEDIVNVGYFGPDTPILRIDGNAFLFPLKTFSDKIDETMLFDAVRGEFVWRYSFPESSEDKNESISLQRDGNIIVATSGAYAVSISPGLKKVLWETKLPANIAGVMLKNGQLNLVLTSRDDKTELTFHQIFGQIDVETGEFTQKAQMDSDISDLGKTPLSTFMVLELNRDSPILTKKSLFYNEFFWGNPIENSTLEIKKMDLRNFDSQSVMKYQPGDQFEYDGDVFYLFTDDKIHAFF